MRWGTTVLIFFVILIPAQTFADNWKTISPGWLYKKIKYSRPENPSSAIYLFKVDPKKIRIDIVTAKQFDMKSASTQTLAAKSGAALVINGGFFDESYNSLGLIIQNGKEMNPIRPISWWGIFWVDDAGAHINHHTDFTPTPDIKAALQVGPRPLVDKTIPKLKEGLPARRSALCTTQDNQVLIVESGRTTLTPHELAEFMLKSELGCIDGLALDGGSSSQLYAKHKNFVLLLEGEAPVANGLALFP